MSGARGSAAATAAATSSSGERALWLALAILVALRGAAALAPGTWLWGLDTLRFLPPWGWIAWLASALLLAPALGRRAAAALPRASAALAGARGALFFALATAAVALLLPDRTRFVGDFLLRQGGVEESLAAGSLFPQALPLDVALHEAWPGWARAAFGVTPAAASGALGALDAALLAWLAVLFARRVCATREALLPVAVLACWGAWLALFTGYSKAFSEMAVLTAAVAVLGLDAVRGRRRPLGAALLVTVALLLHRSALALLPALACALWLAPRATRPPGRPRPRARTAVPGKGVADASFVAAVALPLVALLIAAGRIWRSFAAVDVAHFAGREGGGALRALVAPLHLLDAGNLALFLVPLAPLALLGLARGPAAPAAALDRRQWIFLACLALPLLATFLVIHPAQGIPRDFDVFAAGGVVLAFVTAAVVAGRLRAVRGVSWLAPALVLAAAAPALEYLVLQSDLDLGVRRVEALAAGPPERPAYEQAKMYEFLGARLYRAGRAPEGARFYKRAAELGPSPNIVMGWAIVSGVAGDAASEERAYRLLLARAAPAQVGFRSYACIRLAELTLARGDQSLARRYALQALALSPGEPRAAHVLHETGGPAAPAPLGSGPARPIP